MNPLRPLRALRRVRRLATLAVTLGVLALAGNGGLGSLHLGRLVPGGVTDAFDALTGGGGTTSRARVIRVVDGDTIRVQTGGRDEAVRYIGIDTPETVAPGQPVECFGHQAGAANRRMVEGRRVRLVAGRESRDRYGRLLAYVYADGRLVNERLVAGGYATTLTIAPNTEKRGPLARAQARARAAGRGLWGRCRGR